MADSPLLSKSKALALEMIKVCNEIKSAKRESVLTNQLVRSGTSINAITNMGKGEKVSMDTFLRFARC